MQISSTAYLIAKYLQETEREEKLSKKNRNRRPGKGITWKKNVGDPNKDASSSGKDKKK